jgi:GDPmannose 4,6-dehydratase
LIPLATFKKRILIIGHTGQDGSLLRESIEDQGGEVFGVSSSGTYPQSIPGCPADWVAGEPESVRKFILALRPDEIYYLAAHHTSSEGRLELLRLEAYVRSHEVHVLGLLNVLDTVSLYVPFCRIFYAASSLVFDGEQGEIQDELSPFSPTDFYGMTKAQGVWLCREFRKKRGLFVSVGILYNHESKYRPAHFLSQKIVRSAARISAGSPEMLQLGNLGARVDWGFAGDYVIAFQEILKLSKADDFIIASGEAHSVQEFAELSFDRFGLDWRNHTVQSQVVLTRQLKTRIGNTRKLKETSGWQPTLDFPGLIDNLVKAEQARLSGLQNS